MADSILHAILGTTPKPGSIKKAPGPLITTSNNPQPIGPRIPVTPQTRIPQPIGPFRPVTPQVMPGVTPYSGRKVNVKGKSLLGS